MPDFTITDLPRELTPDETAYLTSLCSDAVRRWEHEAAQPSHVCKKPHGGKVVKDKHGTRTHQHEPRCHDCGRGLHRPPGIDDVTWLCPNARSVLPPGALDTACECGERV
jgi:hypothetical protein